MAHVETTTTGQRILRYPSGRQPLLVPAHPHSEVLWLSALEDVIRLRRHWNPAVEHTEPCTCHPPCSTSRVDRLVATIKNQGKGMWEERLLILPEDGWRSCERVWLLKHQNQADLRGARCIVSRVGTARNGRVKCYPEDWLEGFVPDTFDVPAAARHQLHIATDFFGVGASETEADEQVIPPARTRKDKPHLPLGKPQRR